MAESLDTSSESFVAQLRGIAVTASAMTEWFVREVLPLEAVLTRYSRQNWHNASDIADLRQEVYVRVCECAQEQIPDRTHTKRFVLTTARNLLIDRVRRSNDITGGYAIWMKCKLWKQFRCPLGLLPLAPDPLLLRRTRCTAS